MYEKKRVVTLWLRSGLKAQSYCSVLDRVCEIGSNPFLQDYYLSSAKIVSANSWAAAGPAAVTIP